VNTLLERLRARKAGSDVSISSVIFDSTMKSRRDALYATLIVVLAVLPIFFMGGVAGAFFEPLAVAYLLAVLASMVVALTVTPALSLMLLGKTTSADRESPVAVWLATRYAAALKRVVSFPRAVVLLAGVAVLAAMGAWPLLGHSLLPAFKERELLVNWSTPPGTSHAETYRITSRVSKELRSLPGVRSVGAHVGRAVTGDQVVGINSSQIWISLDPTADYEKTVAAIRETAAGYPGVTHTVHSYLRDKVREVLTGAGNAIVVRIYGQKMDVLKEKAEEVRQALSDVKGVVDLRTEGQVEELQVQVQVDLDAAGRANVKPGDVRRSTATVFSGLVVGYLFKEQKIYEVVVHGAPEARQSLTNLRDLWVEKADRTHARLGDIAAVRLVSTPTVLRHERIAPYIDVVANVAGRDAGSVADEVEDRLEKISFPLEYHPELLGETTERQSAQRHMMGVAVAALIGIFLVMQACFSSWRLGLIAFFGLPVSVAGGILAVLVSGAVVSLGSIVGFLAVLGISARNAIMLVDHYQYLEGKEGVPFGSELVVRGAGERLSSVLGGSIAIVAALLPIIAFKLSAGLEIVQPTAVVIVGGLIASTLFTLLVMPTLYILAGSKVGSASSPGTLEVADGAPA
jgi:Cu/Ag efflux pump CusA